MYKYLLEDPEAVAEKNKALKDELKSYEDYAAQSVDYFCDGVNTRMVSSSLL